MGNKKGNGPAIAPVPARGTPSVFADSGNRVEVPQEFRSYLPERSVVTVNKNHRTITVTNVLDMDRIKIKAMASYEEWCALEDQYLLQGAIPLAAVEPRLCRPRKAVREAVRRYWAADLQGASAHFYRHYITEANARNPLLRPARKDGGAKVQNLRRDEMYEVKVVAQHLYVVLRHWVRKPMWQWPDTIRRYVVSHNLLDSHGEVFLDGSDPVSRDQLCRLVRWIVNEHFSLTVGSDDDAERDTIDSFHRRYVLWQPLTPVKTAYRKLGFQVDHEPLRSVFSH